MNKISKVKVNENLKKSISEAVNEIGGFDHFIDKGDVVLLKPNFNIHNQSHLINHICNFGKKTYHLGSELVVQNRRN